MTKSPNITIVIPNLHSQIIDQTIKSILEQESSYSYEIIVVGMDKWGLVEKFSEVTFIRTPSPISAAEARNIGIQKGKADWFFFIDSDCIAKDRWIKTLADDLNKGWKAIGGGVTTPKEPFWRLVYNLSMFHSYFASGKRRVTKFLPTLNLAVHREVIEKIGLMDEALLRGQDVDWTARMTLAGYKLLFDPLAAVEHHPKRQDLKTLREYNRKSGYFMIRVRHRYPEIFHMPKLLKLPIIWRVFSPLIAGVTTLKIFINSREVRKHIKTLPYIYLLKLSWCRGAAESLGQSEYDQAIA